MTQMTTTASHLVQFYGYEFITGTKFGKPAIELRSPDGQAILIDANVDNPFDKITFIGFGDEINFMLTSIFM